MRTVAERLAGWILVAVVGAVLWFGVIAVARAWWALGSAELRLVAIAFVGLGFSSPSSAPCFGSG
jgi:hypothetical protein